MRYLKYFALPAFALVLSGAQGLYAGDRDWDDRHDSRYNREDVREEYRDIRRDGERADRLRADIDRDQWRLNEAIRCGNDRAAARVARDLARDQRALSALERDMRHDRRDVYRDSYRDRRDSRDDSSYRDNYWRGR